MEAKVTYSIPLFRPFSTEEEKTAVCEVLDSGWWGSGSQAKALEDEFKTFVEARHAVSVNSATAGLHLALIAAGISYGDEVITTALSFVSTSAAIVYVGATPVFADVDPFSLNLDPLDVARKITPYTKAILVVHYGGAPADLAALRLLCETHHLILIEDCAHAAGAHYQGKPIGSASDLAIYSMHAVKHIASPDGGMVVTKNAAWAERMARLRWMGIDRDTYSRVGGTPSQYAWQYDIEELGYKYHLSDVAAAIARVQLARLPETNLRRQQIVARYLYGFHALEWLQLPHCVYPESGSVHAWHLFVLRCDDRDGLIAHLRQRGIATGVHYRPTHLYSAFEQYRTSLPVVEAEWLKLISLPLFPSLQDDEVDYIIEAVRDFRV